MRKVNPNPLSNGYLILAKPRPHKRGNGDLFYVKRKKEKDC